MKLSLKMKTWGCFLIMVLCMGLIACTTSNEDDNGGGGNNDNGSKISSIVMNGYEGNDELRYTYDEQGRVTRVHAIISDDGEQYIYETTYTYYENTIVQVEYFEDDEERFITVYTLNENGLVHKMEYDDSILFYDYDSENRAIRTGYQDEQTSEIVWNDNITWRNGNIVKESNGDAEEITYYENTTDTYGINGLYCGLSGDEWGVLYQQGYFGKKSINLMKHRGWRSFTYTMNNNKVKTMNVRYEDSYIPEGTYTTITFNYE